MESMRSVMVQSIAVEMARSAARSGGEPSAEMAARDPKFEAAVCESVRSWCGQSDATLTCPPANGNPAGYGACLIEFGGDRLPSCSRMLVLLGDLGGVGIPKAWSILADARVREQALVAVFVYRDIGMKQVPHVLVEAGKVTVMLMFIVANALLFAHVLTTERIPQQIAETIIGWGMAPWQFLIVVNILLLIAGMFMEPTGIILILAPILFPIAMQLGIDPVHLGIIMVVNLEIGMITPPIGLNLFVTAGITKMSIGQVVRAALPWTMVLLLFLVIVTYVPAITLFLPNLLF